MLRFCVYLPLSKETSVYLTPRSRSMEWDGTSGWSWGSQYNGADAWRTIHIPCSRHERNCWHSPRDTIRPTHCQDGKRWIISVPFCSVGSKKWRFQPAIYRWSAIAKVGKLANVLSVCLCVCVLVATVSRARRLNRSRCLLRMVQTRVGPRNRILDDVVHIT